MKQQKKKKEENIYEKLFLELLYWKGGFKNGFYSMHKNENGDFESNI